MSLEDQKPADRIDADEKADAKVEYLDNVESSSPLSWTDEDEARIRQRLDWRLMPVIFLLYLLCFIDRANIGNARIQGMSEDLHLVGYRFNWALTVFFISYSLIEIPSNIALKMIGGRYYIPGLVVTFGMISLCTSLVHNYEGLLACRFFLGLAEGGMMPGIAYFLSTFYRKHELMFRVAIFITGASLAGAFGGLLAAGLSPIPHWGTASRPIHDWRNIFFFEGLFTILVAIGSIFLLPAGPAECKFLTKRDKAIAAQRIINEHIEQHNEKTRLHHVYRAIFNINNVVCGVGLCLVNISVQSISLFLPTILRALGWTAIRTQLYSVPPYVVASLYAIGICWISDKLKQRGIFAVLNSLIAIVGFAMLVATDRPALKYAATFFAASGSFVSGPMYVTWGMNNAAGPTIRAITSAYIVTWAQVGGFVAVWAYLPRDAPKYLQGHTINLAAHCVCVFIAIIGIFYARWENAVRDRGGRDHRLQGLTEQQQRELGYRHPSMRYVQ